MLNDRRDRDDDLAEARWAWEQSLISESMALVALSHTLGGLRCDRAAKDVAQAVDDKCDKILELIEGGYPRDSEKAIK